MALPAVLAFRFQLLNSRRRGRWESEPERVLATLFVGPLLLLAGLGVRQITRDYLVGIISARWFFFLAMGAILAAGVSRQWRYGGDRPWHRFAAAMPISPRDLWIVRVYTGMPVTVIGVLMMGCGLSALGVGIWELAALVPIGAVGLLVAQTLAAGVLGNSTSEWRLLGRRWIRSGLGDRMGPAGEQIVMECLRMIRGRWSRLMMFTGISAVVLAALGDRHPQIAAVVIATFAACAISERSNVLLNRRGDVGYDVYGVDGTHYLRALIFAAGCAVSAACIVQLPLVWRAGIHGRLFVGVGSICVGISFASLGRLLAFDSRPRVAATWNKSLTCAVAGAAYAKESFLAAGLLVLRLEIIRMPALAVAALMWVAAFRVGALAPLAVAAAAVYLEGRLANRRRIALRYWRGRS